MTSGKSVKSSTSNQSLFDDTYRFTKDCVDKNYGDVREQLNKSASYCVEKPCWNTTRDYFCLCGHEQWNSTQTGCDYISDDIPFKNHYLPEDYAAFNNSFSNILYGTVRLMVHLSTENYPDFICESQINLTMNSCIHFNSCFLLPVDQRYFTLSQTVFLVEVLPDSDIISSICPLTNE